MAFYKGVMSQLSANCPKSKNFFFDKSCKFEPRYDYEGPTDLLKEEMNAIRGTKFLSNADKTKLLERRTYVKDVCVNCGRSIMR